MLKILWKLEQNRSNEQEKRGRKTRRKNKPFVMNANSQVATLRYAVCLCAYFFLLSDYRRQLKFPKLQHWKFTLASSTTRIAHMLFSLKKAAVLAKKNTTKVKQCRNELVSKWQRVEKEKNENMNERIRTIFCSFDGILCTKYSSV